MQNGKNKTHKDVSLQSLEDRFRVLTGETIEYGEQEEYKGGEEEDLISLLNQLPPVPTNSPFSKEQQEKEQGQITRQRKMNRHELLNGKLREACKKGDIDEVMRQMEQGASPFAEDEQGKSAISYAKENKNKEQELLKILVNNSEKKYQKETVEKNKHKSQKSKEKKLPLPAYTTFGSIACGALGASGCLAIACAYASSWAFPPAGIALTIIGGCMALGFFAGAIAWKIKNDCTTPFLKKTENDNNENRDKKQNTTIKVSNTYESSESNTPVRLY